MQSTTIALGTVFSFDLALCRNDATSCSLAMYCAMPLITITSDVPPGLLFASASYLGDLELLATRSRATTIGQRDAEVERPASIVQNNRIGPWEIVREQPRAQILNPEVGQPLIAKVPEIVALDPGSRRAVQR